MVKIFASLALLLLPITVLAQPAPTAAPAAPTNLDFEEGTDQHGRPTGWIGGGHGYLIAEDGTVAHGGTASGRIKAPKLGFVGDKAAAPLIQRVSAEAWRGKRVRLSGWLQTRDITVGWGGLWMRVDSATKTNLAFDNMPHRGPRGTTDWARYEVVLDVAEEASVLSFGVVLVGNGTVWADDLMLEEVPRSVPTTAGK